MKKRRQCPLCHSRRIGHLEEVQDTAANRMVVGTDASGLFTKRIGQLEAYVCTDCGYYQTYVKTPESIPYEQLEGFRWVEQQPVKGPFR